MKGQIFNSIQLSKPKKNVFDLSHERKLSMKFGALTPILLEEVVPGDSFRCRTEHMLRLPPMLAPIMHRINVFTHFFFVPTRTIWNNYENFWTGGKDGKTFPVFPVLQLDSTDQAYFKKGTLADYFGLPVADETPVTTSQTINALPFRAYQKIYNEYYRDQNLIDEIPIDLGDGSSNVLEALTLRFRAFEKDYYTSLLPNTQRGDDVLIPTNVQYKPNIVGVDGSPNIGQPVTIGTIGSDTTLLEGTTHLQIENIESLGSTINDLRTSVRLQEFLERSMRGGARYVEHVLSFFGVHSKDARLQRAEFLGGGKSPVVISEVLSTFDSTETAGATMYGHGVSAGSNHSFSRGFSEHGYIVGIMSVLPRTAYQQGIDKMWLKRDRYEFFYPQFAHLGEQAVLNKEVYLDWLETTSGDNDKVFGYTPRYAEYKYRQSSVHGDFRDNLDFWHMGRKFSSRPALNQAFVEANPANMNRIFADTTDTDKLYVQLYNDVKAIRPMPIFGTPSL